MVARSSAFLIRLGFQASAGLLTAYETSGQRPAREMTPRAVLQILLKTKGRSKHRLEFLRMAAMATPLGTWTVTFGRVSRMALTADVGPRSATGCPCQVLHRVTYQMTGTSQQMKTSKGTGQNDQGLRASSNHSAATGRRWETILQVRLGLVRSQAPTTMLGIPPDFRSMGGIQAAPEATMHQRD